MKVVPVIDLDGLDEPVARVTVNGKQYNVMPVSGVVFDIAVKMQEEKKVTPAETIAHLRRVMKEVIPTMPETVIGAMSVKQMSHVINLASGEVEKVQRAIAAHEKNAARPVRRAGKARGR